MEVDERPTEQYSDIGGLDKQIQEVGVLNLSKGEQRQHASLRSLIISFTGCLSRLFTQYCQEWKAC